MSDFDKWTLAVGRYGFESLVQTRSSVTFD